MTTRGPDFAHLRQWREAAGRRHRQILADVLSAEEQPDTDFADAAHVWGIEEGRQPQDHGWPDDGKGSTLLETINITSLRTAEAALLARRTAVFVQEHAIPDKLHAGWAKRALAKGYCLLLSPTDPESAVPKGGVGILAPRDYRPTEMPALTKEFQKARKLGRAMRVVIRVVIRVGGRVAVPIYNIYGFPGGHTDKEAARRTDTIIMAIKQEILARGDIYAALVGDLNACPEDLPALEDLIQSGGWTDLGAHPRWTEGRAPEPTCFVAHARGTRRDYVFVDPHLVTLVQGFRVSHEDTFPVHRPLQFTLGGQPQSCMVYRVSAPVDPLAHLALDPDSEEGRASLMAAQTLAFKDVHHELLGAAMCGDADALFAAWSGALEAAFLACIRPEVKQQRGLAAFCGRGATRVRKVALEPPRPHLLGSDQLEATFQTSPAAHARRLARTAKRLWAEISASSRRAQHAQGPTAKAAH